MTTLTWSDSQIPVDFLAKLITQQATGKLVIQNPLDDFVTWQVYLGKGKIQHKIKYWWGLHSYISSPFQRPLIEDWQQFQAGLEPKKQNDSQWLEQFAQSLKDLSCLYEIARATQTSALELALLLRPQIKGGEVKMLSYQKWQAETRPLVISVNHHASVQKLVQIVGNV